MRAAARVGARDARPTPVDPVTALTDLPAGCSQPLLQRPGYLRPNAPAIALARPRARRSSRDQPRRARGDSLVGSVRRRRGTGVPPQIVQRFLTAGRNRALFVTERPRYLPSPSMSGDPDASRSGRRASRAAARSMTSSRRSRRSSRHAEAYDSTEHGIVPASTAAEPADAARLYAAGLDITQLARETNS